MNSSIAWLKTRSSTTKILLHVVFVVKYRRKALSDKMLLEIENIFSESLKAKNCLLLEFNGEADHVHFLVQISPTVCISDLVKLMKGRSSRLVREKYRIALRPTLWGKHLWSPSYCIVSCGGASIDTIRAYIENQDRPS
jgi:putative transposase